MREIKFRGYNKRKEKWYYGFLGKYNFVKEKDYYIDDGFCNNIVEEDSIGQYTGFKDNNGVEIYEGDIVRYETYDEMDTYINRAEVYFDTELGAWMAHEEREEEVSSDIRLYSMNGKVEVIGNTYEEIKGGQIKMKGYKGFDKDLRCRGFQYEIGKEYEFDGEIEICASGFHFCKELIDIMDFYDTKDGNRFCEIEATGEIIEDNKNKKCCTNKIKIIKEIPIEEVLKKVNTGDYNTGDCNTGYCNTGNCNTGNYNTGNCNTGNCNTGNCNTGLFNTDEPNARLFNKISNIKMSEIDIDRINYILSFIDKRDVKLIWKNAEDMTAEEKEKYPEHTTTGGALMKEEVKVNVQEEWEKVSQDDKDFIKSLPNFDKDIFYECTGIKV